MSTQLTTLCLQNFRNYSKKEFNLENKTLIVGENGVGKTNILEAVYLLATGKSFRADRDAELIKYDCQFAIVKSDGLQITITDRKKFEVNGIPRRQMDFVGKLKAVLFAPQDMELITGSPSARRRYLDFVICQMDREYRRCLLSFEKGLRQRNKLLTLIRDGLANRSQLFFWDRLLIKDGDYITQKRQEYLNEDYLFYDKSIITEERLKQYEHEEVAAGTTLVGPHRDDFVINYQNRDVSKYGSRGEQRMMVWQLKQKEITYLGDNPILLLDDIFSELDHKHQEEVMQLISNYPGQVIMTSCAFDSRSPWEDMRINLAFS